MIAYFIRLSSFGDEYFVRRPGSVRLWAAALAGLVAILTGYVISQPDNVLEPVQVPAAIGLLAIGCFAPVLIFRRRAIFAASLYAVLTFATFGLGATAWLGTPRGAAPGITQEWIATALILASGGVFAFWIGYRILSPGGTEPVIRAVRLTLPLTVWGVFALGILFNIVLLAVGAFGYLRNFSEIGRAASWVQWVAVGSQLTEVALYISAIHAFGNESRRYVRATLLMLAINALIGFASGFKGQILWPLAWVFVIYYYYKRRLPKGPMIVALAALIVIVPANLSYRTLARDGETAELSDAQSVLEATGQSLTAAFETPIGDRVSLLAQWASARFRNIDSVALVVAKTPAVHPYLEGELYKIAIPVILVPRALWPSKPSLEAGYVFSQQYVGLLPSQRTSIPVTQPGDLYMNFGVPGVILGMTLWGMLVALLTRWFMRQQGVAAFLFFIVALGTVTNIEADFVSMAASGFRTLLLTAIVGRLVLGTLGKVEPRRTMEEGTALQTSSHHRGR
jgi:hypothetical protein